MNWWCKAVCQLSLTKGRTCTGTTGVSPNNKRCNFLRVISHGDTGCASLKPSTIAHLMENYELRSEAPLCPGNWNFHLKTLNLPLVLSTGGEDFMYLTSLLCFSAEVVHSDMKWSQLWIWVPWKGLAWYKIVFHCVKMGWSAHSTTAGSLKNSAAPLMEQRGWNPYGWVGVGATHGLCLKLTL